MGNNKIGKNSKAAAVGQLIAGAKKHFPKGSQAISLEGASTTIGATLTQLQAFIDNRTAVVTAQATAKTKLAVERTAMPALNALIEAFTDFVKLSFGPQADVLADFGIPAPKAKTPMTAEQKAVAAAKRNATREARGTKGPKAKQAVHGNITAQLVVTPASPPAEGSPTVPATEPAAPAQGAAVAQPPKG
jgi:hypothetical protein